MVKKKKLLQDCERLKGVRVLRDGSPGTRLEKRTVRTVPSVRSIVIRYVINFYTIRYSFLYDSLIHFLRYVGKKKKEKEKEKEKQQQVLLKKIEENPNPCVIVISFHTRFPRDQQRGHSNTNTFHKIFTCR
ncbi:hypothetical protein QFZ31_001280 [Neobacillus niacini]|nr:hypothetical protein [Neobacillus niacini]